MNGTSTHEKDCKCVRCLAEKIFRNHLKSI